MLSEEELRHVAKLARISLTDEEVKKFTPQLSNVFEYMEILNELDTENVKETSQVTGLNNVLEEDFIKPAQSTREEMLACSPLPVDSKQVRVMPVIK